MFSFLNVTDDGEAIANVHRMYLIFGIYDMIFWIYYFNQSLNLVKVRSAFI